MKGETMISVDEAIAIILGAVRETGEEVVDILEAQGRILYRDIVATDDIPLLDNSAMDGFALRSETTTGATAEQPAQLRVVGEVQAGAFYHGEPVAGNAAVRIMTGAPVPPGADVVVPVEDTDETDSLVRLYRPFKKGENIRLAGEDIRAGSIVLEKGRRLRPADIGLLASVDCTGVPVYRRPRVAIISTGDELAEPGRPLLHGQIRNSSAYALSAEVQKYNAVPRYLGIARDTFDDTLDKFRSAFECDIVITTGGVSMGKYDYVKSVMAEMGVEIAVQKILMKPGKPLVFGTLKGKLFFGLPGNPVSSLVSFVQFVRPAILKTMGARVIDKPVLDAIIDDEINKKEGRRHFVRGFFSIQDGELHVSTTGPQGSGILSSMSHANCFILLREGQTVYRKSERVPVQLIYHEEV
jgi:molybdopterin molybdotransferase